MRELIKTIKEMKYYWIIYSIFFIGAIIVSISEIKGFGVFWFDEHRSIFFNLFFESITKLGEFYIFLFFLLYYLYKNSRISFSIASTGLAIIPLSYLLKLYFKHPRPITYIHNYINKNDFKGIENIDYNTGYNSFPSGHTFAAFALFTLLALISKNKYFKILYLFLAILVGLSRVYLVQHFIEDVVFGSMLGIILALFIYFLFFDIWKNKKFPDITFYSKQNQK